MTRDELAVAAELRLLAHAPTIAVDILDIIRQREETILNHCRSAIQAEIDYQAAIHKTAGSKYGRERRERFIEFARLRRDRAAKELGL